MFLGALFGWLSGVWIVFLHLGGLVAEGGSIVGLHFTAEQVPALCTFLGVFIGGVLMPMRNAIVGAIIDSFKRHAQELKDKNK